MLKILTIIGARPQIIKAAAISRAIKNHYQHQIEEIIVHTGQHYDENMSRVFFTELEVPREKYNLHIGSGSHADQTARMMIEINKVVEKEKPTVLLLYGDTNSTLAACLVAIKIHLPVIHVEAGVRSYKKMYPEEVNRLICDHVSSLLFVPSDAGMEALKKEGFDTGRISNVSADHPQVYRCGDIMYDNTLYYVNKVETIPQNIFERLDLPKNNYILATMHRPNNVDEHAALENILKAFVKIIQTNNTSIVLPLHPRTRNIIENNDKLKTLMNVTGLYTIPPVSFLDITQLEKNASLIITDSGGVQKEAYFMKKPCLIMLEETPWTELVETGTAKLVGSSYDLLCEGARYFLQNAPDMQFPPLYGDGKAAEFICERIIEHFGSLR
ncbi:MAG TPA: UDP-N-acetylglucosamine 2-epimerase (non-hydrolyzing) [Flavobacteriales bacterium]|nr:UDP-N-acetylglucosamine 2-epimerase (non-hydrolyzing) [Flavobacteriales bacterium]